MQYQMTASASNNDSAAVADDEHCDKRHETGSEVCLLAPMFMNLS
jgi:hypothetical protein